MPESFDTQKKNVKTRSEADLVLIRFSNTFPLKFKILSGLLSPAPEFHGEKEWGEILYFTKLNTSELIFTR